MSSSSLMVTWSWLEASLVMASSMCSILVLGRVVVAMVAVLNESTKLLCSQNLRTRRSPEKGD